MLNCVIIDDDKAAVDLLAGYVADTPGLTLLKTYTQPLEALDELSAGGNIDIMLVDIDMPFITGFDLARMLRDKISYLVFTTAHIGFGAQAFDLNAHQYLVKPICFSKFVSVMNVFIGDHRTCTREKSATAYIKGGFKNSYIPVKLSEIAYVEAMKNYVKIFIAPGSPQNRAMIVTHLGIKEMEKVLDPLHFIRIHRSYIVAKSEIKEVLGNTVILKNDVELDIGINYKSLFLQYLKTNMLG